VFRLLICLLICLLFCLLFCLFFSLILLSLILSLILLSHINRYVAIVHPFKSLICFQRHISLIILIIWIIGIAIASPLLVMSRAIPFRYGRENYLDCRELWEEKLGGRIYTGVIFIFTFTFPLIILSFLYASIGIKTFRNITPGNADNERDQMRLQTKRKVCSHKNQIQNTIQFNLFFLYAYFKRFFLLQIST
jgi:hypothetical protein